MKQFNMLMLCVIHALLSVATSSSEICPSQEDIYPCLCWGSGHSLHGHCRGLTSQSQLERAVQGFSGQVLETFSLDKSSFEYIPHDLFKNVSVRHMTIDKSNFSRIGNLGDPQFEGLERSLRTLSIKECFTEKHPFAYVSFTHLEALRTLEVIKNHVEVLHNEWFREGPAGLEVVRFSEGHIRRVGFRALQALPGLRVVDLSSNDIDYVGRTVLPDPAMLLEEIYLQRNKLTTLPEDFFSGMPSLKKVNLELNEFSTIAQDLWIEVWPQLTSLNIDYNPLICDSKISWIYQDGEDLEEKLVAMCFKPFRLMERELHTLDAKDLE